MEIKEDIEVKVDENQISFDFLNSERKVGPLQQVENSEWVNQETLVVIVKANNDLSYNWDICGKKMVDWVSMALSGCQQRIIDDVDEDQLLDTLRDLSENYNYIAVFYTDTPLLKKSTFLEIMDYFAKNKMNVLKLSRGYVFKTTYLENARMLLSSIIEEFDKEDFTVVDDAKKLSYAFNVLQKRIKNYHKDRGVVFYGEDTTFVDADVEIEKGCVVYPNNIIKGNTYIGKNVILESGNYIIDTIVCDSAFVCNSYLEKSKIEEGKVVGPFARLVNEKI